MSRKGFILLTSLALSVVVVIALTATLGASGAPSPGHRAETLSRANAASSTSTYPLYACDSASPTSLLLPPSDLPSGIIVMGSPYAGGGQPIYSMAMPFAGVTPLSSAAVIMEHAYNADLPVSALQSENSYLADNPTSITTFDEGITGFTDSTAEADFYQMAENYNDGVAPTIMVGDEAQLAEVATTRNDSAFPTPNVVTVISGPASADQATQILITVENGATVVGLGFYGGVDLSVADVSSLALAALNLISAACPNGDIMPSSTAGS